MKSSAIGLGAALLIAANTGVTAHEKLALRVTPSVSHAPAIVKVIARIERDPANRMLEVSADSGEFFRSSSINLEGAQAPSITEVALKNLPGGEYTISVVLVDNLGHKTMAQRSVIVVSSLSER